MEGVNEVQGKREKPHPRRRVYHGLQEEILQQSNEQKQTTLECRFQYNLGSAPSETRAELGTELQFGRRLSESQRC